jgi:hypothetical protein
MTDVLTLPSTVDVEINGVMRTLGVYGSPQEYAQSSDTGTCAIPGDNLGSSVWTGYGVGDMSVIGVEGGAGSRAPGARPVFGVMRPSHATMDTNDIESYTEAFEEATGRKATGAFPVFFILALIIILVFFWTVYSLIMHAIDKDSEVSITDVDKEGEEDTGWVLVCKGGSCQYFNTNTGETLNGPSNDSILTKLLTPIIVVAVVGVGAYAAVKIIGGMKRSGG